MALIMVSIIIKIHQETCSKPAKSQYYLNHYLPQAHQSLVICAVICSIYKEAKVLISTVIEFLRNKQHEFLGQKKKSIGHKYFKNIGHLKMLLIQTFLIVLEVCSSEAYTFILSKPLRGLSLMQ